jgi:heme-degrading monooxygenase HmoA
MDRIYTAGEWTVKPGKENEFAEAWRELAEWSASEVPGAISATLLRNMDDPRRFVSIGPWESLEAVEQWRALPGFQERVVKLRQLLDSFEPRTLELVAEVP